MKERIHIKKLLKFDKKDYPIRLDKENYMIVQITRIQKPIKDSQPYKLTLLDETGEMEFDLWKADFKDTEEYKERLNKILNIPIMKTIKLWNLIKVDLWNEVRQLKGDSFKFEVIRSEPTKADQPAKTTKSEDVMVMKTAKELLEQETTESVKCIECIHTKVCLFYRILIEQQLGEFLTTKYKDVADFCIYFVRV